MKSDTRKISERRFRTSVAARRKSCRFVADACGSATALGHDISLRRLEQAGVTVMTTASVSAELAGDYPKHAQIMRG